VTSIKNIRHTNIPLIGRKEFPIRKKELKKRIKGNIYE